jgi:outer membrane lipoprotein carrier protein
MRAFPDPRPLLAFGRSAPILALLLTLGAFAPHPALAQPGAPPTVESGGTTSEPAALDLLRRVRDRYAAYQSLSMDFILEIVDLESGETETQRGDFSVRGEAFRFRMGTQTLVCDGDTIWTWLEDVNEVQINRWEPELEEEGFLSPSDLFDLPESEYVARMGPSLTREGKTEQTIDLTPLDRDLDFHTIRLHVRPSTAEVKSAVIMDRNAIHFIYTLANVKANPALAKDHFHFNVKAHENISVIDLR